MPVPPSWVLRELERISPRIRLGYKGGPTFAVLELWRVREAPETILATYTGGHVFGSDYDHLGFVPKHVIDVDVQDVLDGAVIRHVREWARPFKERMHEQLHEKGLEEERAAKDLGGEAGEYLHWRANKSNHRGPVVARKHLTQDDEDVLSGKFNAEHSFEDMYLPDPQHEAPIK